MPENFFYCVLCKQMVHYLGFRQMSLMSKVGNTKLDIIVLTFYITCLWKEIQNGKSMGHILGSYYVLDR